MTSAAREISIRKLKVFRDQVRGIPVETGRIGVANGADARIDGSTNKVWCNDGRREFEVWNMRKSIEPIAGIPMLIVLNEDQQYEFKSGDSERLHIKWGDAAPLVTASPGTSSLSARVDIANLTMLKPEYDENQGGLYLKVNEGWVNDRDFAAISVDLSTYQTATSGKQAWVVVGLDISQDPPALVAGTGSDFLTVVKPMPLSDVETVLTTATFDVSVIPIAAVPLSDTATTFTNADIVDIRDVFRSKGDSLPKHPQTFAGVYTIKSTETAQLTAPITITGKLTVDGRLVIRGI